jgi:hypothetical protein
VKGNEVLIISVGWDEVEDVDENRIQQLIKKEVNKEYENVKTPSCRLCNLHFVHYFSQNKSKLDLEI